MNSPMTRASLVALMVVTASPAVAVDMEGSQIVGYAHNTLPIATPMNVYDAANTVSSKVGSQIQQAGEAITVNQSKQMAAEAKLLSTLKDKLVEIEQQKVIAERQIQADERFGSSSHNAALVPARACTDVQVPGSVFTGDAGTATAAAQARSSYQAYSHSFRFGGAAAKHTNALPVQALDSATLFPGQGGSLTPAQQQQAQDYANLVTDPNPPIDVPQANKGTFAGQQYEAALRARTAKMNLAQDVFAQLIAERTPTMSLGAWARTAWAEEGGKGDPPGLINGKISEASMMDLMVNSRFASERWYTDVQTMTQPQLLREVALMQALSLRMQLQRLRLEQRTAAIEAAQYAEHVDGNARQQLSTLRPAALQQH